MRVFEDDRSVWMGLWRCFYRPFDQWAHYCDKSKREEEKRDRAACWMMEETGKCCGCGDEVPKSFLILRKLQKFKR